MNNVPSFETPRRLLSELRQILDNADPGEDGSNRQDAIRVSTSLTRSLQTPGELAFESCFLPAYSACCRACVHLQLFETITKSSGAITASELAVETGIEHLLIVRLLRIVTGLGLVEEVSLETYQASPATHAMASPMIRAAYQHFWDNSVPCLLRLTPYLETHGGHCPTDARDGLFQGAFGTSLDAFSFWQAHPPPQKALDNFNFLMTCVRGEEPRWLSWFPFRERILEGARPGEVLLVDVGGGRGHDAVAFKKRIDKESPGARVVLQDLPAVLSDVSNLDGIEKVSHDFFTPQVIKGARVYYYAHILHDWSDEACARILRSAKSAMIPKYSKLLIYEFILPDTDCSLLQAGFDIHMMAMHAGMERTKTQWVKILHQEGFNAKFWAGPDRNAESVIEIELTE